MTNVNDITNKKFEIKKVTHSANIDLLKVQVIVIYSF
jgi:hypothetical protein